MKQTRLQSLMETLAGLCIGFVVSMGLSAVVYPLFGHKFSLAENAWITVIFTMRQHRAQLPGAPPVQPAAQREGFAP